MAKQRLDQLMVVRALTPSRSQAESWIKLGKVLVDGKVITKPGYFAREDANIELKAEQQYVSRAGLKLASVAQTFKLDFRGKTVLDVGSSTGGFTDYALRNGAAKVIAVDVGTNQLHPSLRGNPNIELHEQTDIRSVGSFRGQSAQSQPVQAIRIPVPDIVVIDVSFISLREILPHVATLCGSTTRIVAMLKPQFEAGAGGTHKGLVKNDTVRRTILKDFEIWAKQYFVIRDKADSQVAGAHGNRERFYVLSAASTP